MSMLFNYQDDQGGEEIISGVTAVAWDDAAKTLTVTFAEGDPRVFGPNAADGPLPRGALRSDQGHVLANYVFYPVEVPE
ncbi:MAG: hypothetical protein A2792_00140 [Sphingomonadales bacterium RIFCSPHIGHO2_01_FULL_65_20]|nr:MAG: hypothetical protein A2792_00140 [Sphingomonadales bacterium RIFCSPHIGHO2_01_FULL_65_20]